MAFDPGRNFKECANYSEIELKSMTKNNDENNTIAKLGYIAVDSKLEGLALNTINATMRNIVETDLFDSVQDMTKSKDYKRQLTQIVLKRALEMINKSLAKKEKEN